MPIDPFIAVLVGTIVIGALGLFLCAWAIDRGIKQYIDYAKKEK